MDGQSDSQQDEGLIQQDSTEVEQALALDSNMSVFSWGTFHHHAWSAEKSWEQLGMMSLI